MSTSHPERYASVWEGEYSAFSIWQSGICECAISGPLSSWGEVDFSDGHQSHPLMSTPRLITAPSSHRHASFSGASVSAALLPEAARINSPPLTSPDGRGWRMAEDLDVMERLRGGGGSERDEAEERTDLWRIKNVSVSDFTGSLYVPADQELLTSCLVCSPCSR